MSFYILSGPFSRKAIIDARRERPSASQTAYTKHNQSKCVPRQIRERGCRVNLTALTESKQEPLSGE